MINILCVIISDLVKAAPEILPATTIGMFPHFVIFPNCFTQVWEDLVLGVWDVQVTNLAGGVGSLCR